MPDNCVAHVFGEHTSQQFGPYKVPYISPERVQDDPWVRILIAKDAKSVKAMRREIELLRRDEPAMREFRWSPAATGVRVSVV